MNMIELIVLTCWIIFWLYWFISAQSVKTTQETKGPLAGNWQRIVLFIGFLFMINFSFLRRFGIPVARLAVPFVPRTMLTNAAIVILIISGLAVALLARRTLAGNWSGAVALKKDHELITTGLYHYVRHPIYTGILLMAVATTLWSGTLSACIGFLIVLLGIWFKLKEEESLLAEHFPDAYSSYKSHTKILIPFVW